MTLNEEHCNKCNQLVLMPHQCPLGGKTFKYKNPPLREKKQIELLAKILEEIIALRKDLNK